MQDAPRPHRPRLFLSYCHADEVWKRRLLDALHPAIDDVHFDLWSDDRIGPGELWQDKIDAALSESSVAILLVTQRYLTSKFIQTTEFPQILQAANERGLRILWIAAESITHDSTVLSRYKAINDTKRTLADLRAAERRRALVEIAYKVRDAVTSSGLPASPSRWSNPQIQDERWRQTLDICDYIQRYAPKRIDILHFSLMTLSTYEYWATFKNCRDVTFRILLVKPDLAEHYSLKERQRRDVERTAEQIALLDRQLRSVSNRPTVGVWYYQSPPSVAALIADDDLLQLGWYFTRFDTDNYKNLAVSGLEMPGVLLIGDAAKTIIPKIRFHFDSVLASIDEKPLLFGPDQDDLLEEWRTLRGDFHRA